MGLEMFGSMSCDNCNEDYGPVDLEEYASDFPLSGLDDPPDNWAREGMEFFCPECAEKLGLT